MHLFAFNDALVDLRPQRANLLVGRGELHAKHSHLLLEPAESNQAHVNRTADQSEVKQDRCR
jgi:hypothetical protein